MLVAKRLTQHVVVSRLMVGHTHEDIDGCFALIWQLMKALKVSTPQAYSKLVKWLVDAKPLRLKCIIFGQFQIMQIF
jgi:hypothetical protein